MSTQDDDMEEIRLSSDDEEDQGFLDEFGAKVPLHGLGNFDSYRKTFLSKQISRKESLEAFLCRLCDLPVV